MNASKMNLILVVATKNQMTKPWLRNVEGENCDRAANSDVTKLVYKCHRFVEVIARHKHACSVS